MLSSRRDLAGVHVQERGPRVSSRHKRQPSRNAPHHPHLGSFDCREVPRGRRDANVDNRCRDGRVHD
eukprot:13949347-Heterocapsa_arctica.AAC.1